MNIEELKRLNNIALAEGLGFPISAEQLEILSELCTYSQSWPTAPIRNPRECIYYARSLFSLRKDFDNGDNLALLDAVEESRRGDFFMPVWAHNCLADIFIKYYRLDGKETLDSLFQIKKEAGRNNSPLSRRKSKRFEQGVVLLVSAFNKKMKFTLDVTYFLLSKMGIEGTFISSSERKFLSEERIKEIYKKEKWKPSEQDLDDYYYNFQRCYDLWVIYYEDKFYQLVQDGSLEEAGLLDSARRSLVKFLPEPPKILG